ncbi:MFS transporter [Helicobacter sp. MIT 14-3879]|uniref:MFS transporter n=1 Tax=Helicobacter sp. MIT 14-3879 TaxID=2040649 RepID=UPI000E1E83ED|nr:MFS transporter [Helicobacter sp. MIT 14-3879]RDU65013.1 MFS transporter [Helicobacter sp. MIT 14-3879]
MLTKNSLFWLNALILISIAINLRMPITSLGPIIEDIKSHYAISSSLAGFLTSIPIILFGSISFIVGYFSSKKAMLIALCLITIGILTRSYLGLIGLFAGMALLGSGISIANVLLPSFVKEKFPRKTTSMMSLYSLTLNISSILGIWIALPLVKIFGLKNAMALCVIFGIIALILYTPQIKNHRILRGKNKVKTNKNLFLSSSAWKITIFMGLQSFMAYSTFAWYASIIASKGYSQEYGSNILLLSQFVATPVSLFGPLIFGYLREKYRVFYMAFLCILYILGYGILLIGNNEIILYISAIALGIPMGGVFGIALLFITIKAQTTPIAAKLSSMAQGFGYLIASSGPFIIGFCNDYFGEFNEAIIIILFVAIILNIFGILAYKCSVIKD